MSAALVCKAFAEPASEALWDLHFNTQNDAFVDFLKRTLSTLTLGRCGPKPASSRRHVRAYVRILRTCVARPDLLNQVVTQMLNGEIIQDEWESLMRRASRVHAVRYPSNTAIAPGVSKALSERLQGRPLFPNLKHFIWAPCLDDIDDQHALRMLLSSTVVSVRVRWPARDAYGVQCPGKLREGVEIIASSCGALRKIEFSTVSSVDDVLPLRACRDLRIAHLGTASVDVAEYITSTFPKLEELGLMCSNRPRRGPPTPHTYEPRPSRTLTRFFLASRYKPYMNTSIAHTPPLAHASRLPSVSASFIWTVHRTDTGHDGNYTAPLLLALETLCVAPLANTLRTLHVRLTWSHRDPPPGSAPAHFGAACRPLLLLPALEELDVAISHRRLVVTPQDLARMAAAWPALAFLSLRDERAERWDDADVAPPRPPLLALVAFAARCPALEVLRVIAYPRVEPEHIQALEDFADGGSDGGVLGAPTGGAGLGALVGQRLTQLRFEHIDVVIADVPRLAAALRSLFPRLRGASTFWQGRRRAVVDPADRDKWKMPQESSDAFTLLEELDRERCQE